MVFVDRLPWKAAVAALSLLLALSAKAGIPEPGLIYYGEVSIDGTLQTASSATVISVTRGQSTGGEEIARYVMGNDSAASDLYVLRIQLESLQGGPLANGVGQLGDAATLLVNDVPVGLIHVGGRGRAIRMDLGVTSAATPSNSDPDSTPDYLDNCPIANETQTDVNPRNGIGDACEMIVNPGASFALIGDPGNPADVLRWGTGKGSVETAFGIANSEVTNAEYRDFLEAVASAADPNGLYNELMASDARGGILREGSQGSYAYLVKPNMGDKPVNFVSWLDAARFTNWVANGEPTAPPSASTTEDGAFDLTDPDPLVQVTAERKEFAAWGLLTEDEWYKAAYYDPSINEDWYWKYPTREDEPGPLEAVADGFGDVARDPAELVANFNSGAQWNGVAGNVTTVGPDLGVGPSRGTGSPSYYATYDQGGNVAEWLSDAEGGLRVVRGGSYLQDRSAMSTVSDSEGGLTRDDVLRDPFTESPEIGFRVPEPGVTSGLIGGILALGSLCRRRRGRC